MTDSPPERNDWLDRYLMDNRLDVDTDGDVLAGLKGFSEVDAPPLG